MFSLNTLSYWGDIRESKIQLIAIENASTLNFVTGKIDSLINIILVSGILWRIFRSRRELDYKVSNGNILI